MPDGARLALLEERFNEHMRQVERMVTENATEHGEIVNSLRGLRDAIYGNGDEGLKARQIRMIEQLDSMRQMDNRRFKILVGIASGVAGILLLVLIDWIRSGRGLP